jgi:hypothetical protein
MSCLPELRAKPGTASPDMLKSIPKCRPQPEPSGTTLPAGGNDRPSKGQTIRTSRSAGSGQKGSHLRSPRRGDLWSFYIYSTVLGLAYHYYVDRPT